MAIWSVPQAAAPAPLVQRYGAALRVRRGVFFNVVQPMPVLSPGKLLGSRPRVAPRTRRGGFFQFPEPFTGIPFFTFQQQRGSRPRFAAKQRRGVFLQFPQPFTGISYFAPVAPVGNRPRWLPKLRRGVIASVPNAAAGRPVFAASRRPRLAVRPTRRVFFPVPQVFTGVPFFAPVVQSGSRPRWLAKLRRGVFTNVAPQVLPGFPVAVAAPRRRVGVLAHRARFFEPVWSQGALLVAFPGLVHQPGARPRTLPRLRRSSWFSPPWLQGSAATAVPAWITQPGAHPRWAPKRRGRFAEPVWPQVLGNVPQLLSRHPRFAPRARRSTFWEFQPPQPGLPVFAASRRPRLAVRPTRRVFFPVPQVFTGVPFFAPVVQAGAKPRWLPKQRRGVVFAVPAKPLGTPLFGFTVQSGSRPRWLAKLRRGVFTNVAPQVLPGFPATTAAPRRRVGVLAHRARFFEPVWSQGALLAAYPVVAHQAGSRPRWLPKLRRGRFTEPPWPQGSMVAPVPVWLTQSGARPRWLPKARSRRFEPPWVQGPQVGPALWLRQSGARPRVAPVLRRGRFTEPPWPQGSLLATLPLFRGQAGARPRVLPRLRRSSWFSPPWPQGALGSPWPTWVAAARRPRYGPIRRATFTPPAWPQGPVNGWTPAVIRPRPRIWAALTPRRMRHITPPWPWTKNAVFLTGHAALKWVIGGIRASRWSIGSVATKWSIGGIVTSVANQPVSISAQALEYVDVGPVVVTVNGVPVNPTADPVSMAFMATTATPGVSDWKTASWNANGTNYFAQCLVGTGGAVSLAAGNWYVWVKIQDSPELVIRQVDILNIY